MFRDINYGMIIPIRYLFTSENNQNYQNDLVCDNQIIPFYIKMDWIKPINVVNPAEIKSANNCVIEIVVYVSSKHNDININQF